MTELQKHLMQLVKEIKDTCKEQNIEFALCGQTAGRAAAFHKFKTQCCEFHIMMRTCDILKLKKALSAKKIPNRGWEDLSTNPKLANNYVRYVDLATTVYDRDVSLNFDKLGVAVTIRPIYANRVTKRDRRLELGTFYMNHGMRYSCYDMSEDLKQVLETTEKFRRLFGEKFVGRKVYSIFRKERNATYKDKVYMHDDEGKLVPVSKKAITELEMIQFEGMKLPVSKDRNTYFRQLYGNDWKKLSVAPMFSVNRIWAIYDENKPYEQFLSEQKAAGIDIRQLQKEYREFKTWSEQVLLTATDAANHTYEYARRSVDRIDLYEKYRERMPQIKQAAKEKNMGELKKLMKEYLSLTEFYFEKKIGFFVNQELFDYAKLIWESQGEAQYVNEVYDLVPEEYKKEDIKDFLKKYE